MGFGNQIKEENMEQKIVLVVVDGLRADALSLLDLPFIKKLKTNSTFCLKARSVVPALTLPCMTSMFHGVEPDRHSIFTNEWAPQIRPIKGLVEQLDDFGKRCAFFTTSEEVRDVCRVNHLEQHLCFNAYRQSNADEKVTSEAIQYVKEAMPDFMLVHLKGTDIAGHRYGYGSEEYLQAVKQDVLLLEKIYEAVKEEHLIVTADHGGEGRNHGGNTPANIFVPMFFYGESFGRNQELENCSITDIAKTVASILGVPPVRDWEGENRAEK